MKDYLKGKEVQSCLTLIMLSQMYELKSAKPRIFVKSTILSCFPPETVLYVKRSKNRPNRSDFIVGRLLTIKAKNP